MDMNTVMGLYVLAAAAVGFVLFREEDAEGLSKKKRVGPSYWGSYKGLAVEPESMRRIEMPKPTKDCEGLAGSAAYSKGKAVGRTARC